MADRLGSYSIDTTRAGIPSLSRFQSMMRKYRLCRPPWCRTDTWPNMSRPECLARISDNDFIRCVFMSFSLAVLPTPQMRQFFGLQPDARALFSNPVWQPPFGAFRRVVFFRSYGWCERQQP